MSPLPREYSAFKGRPLPEKQAAVLDFIRTEIAAGAAFPTNERIASYMGWKSPRSAYDCLLRLQWRGLVCVIGTQRRELVETSLVDADEGCDGSGYRALRLSATPMKGAE